MSRLTRHAPLAALLALWLLFFWRYFIPGPYRVTFPDGDFTQQFYIFRNIAYRALAAGHLPLWADCFFAGYPFHADPQSQLFYPPIWIGFAILKLMGWGNFPPFALTVETIAHYLLVSLFTYHFLLAETPTPGDSAIRNPQSAICNLPALLGSIVFTYGGYLTGYPPLQTGILETVTWLPLILLTLRKLAETDRRSFIGWSALALAVAFFAGHPQTFLFVAYLALAYFIHRAALANRSWRWTLTRLAAVYGLCFGIVLIQLLPQAQYLSLSTRSSLSFDELSHGFPLGIVKQFIFRDAVWSPLYVGILPFILAIVAAIHSLSAMRRIARFADHAPRFTSTYFWLITTVLSLLLSLGGDTPIYSIAYWLLPGYRLFRGQERIAVLVSFALAVLAAFGAQWLLSTVANRWKEHWRIAAGVGLLTIAVLDLYSARTPTNLVPPFDPYPYLPILDPIRADADPFFRVQDDARMQGHFACGYGFKEWGGISPIRPAAWNEFDLRAPESLRWKVIGMKYLITWKNGALTREGELPPAERVAEGPAPQGDAKVYRMFEIPRRAWLVYQTQPAADADSIFAALQTPGFDPFSAAVINSPSPLLRNNGGEGRGEEVITVTADYPGHLSLQVTTGSPAVLVISEAHYPGWTAQVNGKTTPVLEADAFLQAVPVPAGESTVVLDYRPLTLIIGTIVSGLVLVLAVGVILRART